MSSSNRAKVAATPEQSQVAAISAVAESVRASAAAATTEHEHAREAHAAASAALTEAEARYAADPEDSAAATVHSAERSLRLAAVRLEATKKKKSEADRALEGSSAALAAATLEARKIGLADRSSPAHMASEIAEPWRVFLSAYAALDRASLEIGAALKDSHSASAELRALGTYERDIDQLHAILPALDWLASRGVIPPDLDAVRPSNGVTATSLVAFLEAHGKAQPAPSNHLNAYRSRLARLRATRTALESRALEEQEAKEQSTRALANYRMPVPLRPAGPAPIVPTLVPAVNPNETSTARRSSAPNRRHDE